jgi:hypothetical protein
MIDIGYRMTKKHYKDAMRVYRILANHGVDIDNMPRHARDAYMLGPPDWERDPLTKRISWRLDVYKQNKRNEYDGIPF